MCKHILHTRPYKVSQEPVSIHLPITRLLTGKLLKINRFDFLFVFKCFKRKKGIIGTVSLINFSVWLQVCMFSCVRQELWNTFLTLWILWVVWDILKPTSNIVLSLLCVYYRAVYMFQEQMDLPFYAEFPLRCVVLAAQVSAEMWRRNGLSLVSQVRGAQILVYLLFSFLCLFIYEFW